jgi:hypothetical protein
MDEAAEPVVTTDLALRRSLTLLVEFGRPEFEGAMRPLAVVVVDVDAEYAFEVTAVEDQQPVETLGTHSADEALGDRVRLRRPHWRLDDSDAFTAEHLVERPAVLAVAVTNQEPNAVVEKSRPRLRACWVTQSPVGLVVQPASHTRRLPWAMKNSA